MIKRINIIKPQIGFTIIETLVIVVIVAFLVAISIPSYVTFVRNNQANGIAARLAETIRLAKSTAISDTATVTICPISSNSTPADGLSNSDICLANTTTWDAWKVFVDVGGDGDDDNSEQVLEYVNGIPAGTVTTDRVGSISFDSTGFVSGGGTITFTVTPTGCVGNFGRRIDVRLSGTITTTVTACP